MDWIKHRYYPEALEKVKMFSASMAEARREIEALKSENMILFQEPRKAKLKSEVKKNSSSCCHFHSRHTIYYKNNLYLMISIIEDQRLF